MKSYIDKKKDRLAVVGFEPVVEQHQGASRMTAEAEEQMRGAEAELSSTVWSVLGALAGGGVPGEDLGGFLGWKSSRVHLLGPGGSDGLVITIPSHGAAGNFKEITDVGLLAQVSEDEGLRSLLISAVKERPAEAAAGRRVELRGELAEWFLKHLVASESNPDGSVAADHSEMTVSEPAAPKSIVTVSQKGFAQLVRIGAEGNALARRLVAAGFKKWLVKEA